MIGEGEILETIEEGEILETIEEGEIFETIEEGEILGMIEDLFSIQSTRAGKIRRVRLSISKIRASRWSGASKGPWLYARVRSRIFTQAEACDCEACEACEACERLQDLCWLRGLQSGLGLRVWAQA